MSETPHTTEMIRHMLDMLERPSRTLTAWELGFLSDITDQFERQHRLSDRQFETLERIYAEKTE